MDSRVPCIQSLTNRSERKMNMSIFSRIKKKIARRFRKKGVAVQVANLNYRTAVTAQGLWESTFSFNNNPPAKAGQKRAMKRELAERKTARDNLAASAARLAAS